MDSAKMDMDGGYGREIQLLNKIQELNPIPENDFLEMLG